LAVADVSSLVSRIDHDLITESPDDQNEQRTRKAGKGERETGVCSVCGMEGPITSDHVIATNLFRRDADSLIEAPLCDNCHTEKNRGEERLRDVVAIDVGGAEHPEALRQTLTAIRAHNRRPGRSTERILGRRQIEVFSPSGVYLGDAFELDWDFDPVLRTLEIAVRGLHRHFRNELLPPDTPVRVVFIKPLHRAKILQTLSRFRPRDLIVMGNGIAHIASYEGASDHPTSSFDHPTSSFWTITFNYGVLFVAGTGSFADAIERMTAGRQHESP
jgi:hypothetical protein